MKKIIVFGDSYVRYDWVSEKTDILSWPFYLSKNLNLPIINFGISGSGLNYSMVEFNKYLNSENYDNNDIIVWALTNEQRLYDPTMPHPSLGIFYNLLDVIHHRSLEEQKWINENKKHALWSMENILHPSINYNILKIVSFLKVWANQNKNNTVVVIRCFRTLPGGEFINNLLSIIDEGSNFFPILNDNDTLSNISGREFKKSNLHQYMLQKNINSPGLDYRVNHLSPENRIILANQIFNIITNKSLKYWNRSEFKENLYSNEKEVDLMNTDFF
jgi:hypothetical protein